MRVESAVDLAKSHVFVDGKLVSAKLQTLVQAIEDYSDGELEVLWTPPEARREGQAAFAIVHNPPGGRSYVLRYVKDEESFDERILLWIIANDQRNGKTATLSDIEVYEEAQRRVQKQLMMDRLEEVADITRFALQTKLNKFTIPDPQNPGRVITIRE